MDEDAAAPSSLVELQNLPAILLSMLRFDLETLSMPSRIGARVSWFLESSEDPEQKKFLD